jgi:anti-sigma factor RsiW
MSENHPGEETLNVYLDGELAGGEREQVEAHLGTCETCRVEVETLQRLFVALDGIADAPAPNLAPGTLTRIHPRRRFAGLKWLIPALQGAAALALIAWGWSRLAGYLTALTSALPLKALEGMWGSAAEWAVSQWATLTTWPEAARALVLGWSIRLSGGPSVPLPQLLVLGIPIAVLWLAGNALLLRRALLNGKQAYP